MECSIMLTYFSRQDSWTACPMWLEQKLQRRWVQSRNLAINRYSGVVLEERIVTDKRLKYKYWHCKISCLFQFHIFVIETWLFNSNLTKNKYFLASYTKHAQIQPSLGPRRWQGLHLSQLINIFLPFCCFSGLNLAFLSQLWRKEHSNYIQVSQHWVSFLLLVYVTSSFYFTAFWVTSSSLLCTFVLLFMAKPAGLSTFGYYPGPRSPKKT